MRFCSSDRACTRRSRRSTSCKKLYPEETRSLGRGRPWELAPCRKTTPQYVSVWDCQNHRETLVAPKALAGLVSVDALVVVPEQKCLIAPVGIGLVHMEQCADKVLEWLRLLLFVRARQMLVVRVGSFLTLLDVTEGVGLAFILIICSQVQQSWRYLAYRLELWITSVGVQGRKGVVVVLCCDWLSLSRTGCCFTDGRFSYMVIRAMSERKEEKRERLECVRRLCGGNGIALA